MIRVLALDTASALCSVALLQADEVLTREAATARDHAQLVLPMVDALLAEAGCDLASLDAIAFGRGPGSFTGLRVAAAVAQGLALGAARPVVPVSDLRALALQGQARLIQAPSRLAVACCMDARMGQVYAAFHEWAPADGLPPDAPEQVCDPGAFRPAGSPQVLIGRGFAAYADALEPLRAQALAEYAEAEPRAREIARLAAADFAAGRARDPAQALPVYLRDDVARPAGPS